MIELPCTGTALLNLIPQRLPILMIDAFNGFSGDDSLSSLTINEDNLFVEKKIFLESGLIEHIAQSAAARVGFVCKSQNKSVPIGFIGSVDKLVINELPHVGDVLETKITVLQEVFGITLIQAQVYVIDKLIASCNMKIFLGNEED